MPATVFYSFFVPSGNGIILSVVNMASSVLKLKFQINFRQLLKSKKIVIKQMYAPIVNVPFKCWKCVYDFLESKPLKRS